MSQHDERSMLCISPQCLFNDPCILLLGTNLARATTVKKITMARKTEQSMLCINSQHVTERRSIPEIYI